MPRFVRNFWITVKTGARAKAVETGPRRADGGASITIQYREHGRVGGAISIECLDVGDGTLKIVAHGTKGAVVLAEVVR